jgi:hypothetical protein
MKRVSFWLMAGAAPALMACEAKKEPPPELSPETAGVPAFYPA